MKIKNTKDFQDFCCDIGINHIFAKTTSNKMFNPELGQLTQENIIIPKTKSKKLEILRKKILALNCNLKKSATNMVLASGNPNSRIMIVGEAPGSEEDRTGLPFVGSAGMLLNQMLNSISLSREYDCYITNLIFWRPPGNRTPNKHEIEICLPLVKEHIEIIDPKLIILLGNVAIKSLLGTNKGVTEIRKEENFYCNKEKNINRDNIYSNSKDYQNSFLEINETVKYKDDKNFLHASEFIEIAPLNYEIESTSRKELSSIPISEINFPKMVYMIVDKNIELEIKLLKDYPQWDFLPNSDLNRKTIEIFNDIKVAKRFCKKEQKVIKVPNTDVFRIVAPILISRGISRIVSSEQLISL